MTIVLQPAASWLSAHRTELSLAIAARQRKGSPEPSASVSRARTSMEQDVSVLLDYLGSSILRNAPGLFLDYTSWSKVCLVGLGFDSEHLRARLECVRGELSARAPEALRQVLLAPVDEALDALNSTVEQRPIHIDPKGPQADLARRYLDSMLRSQRREATQLILDAAKDGVSIRDLYLGVLEPVQHEIGYLWQQNALSVAEEHYCTAITQMVISQLYPYIFTAERNERRLVATCVPGDLHEVGVRMIADFFEMDGWDTWYLGADVPTVDVVETVGRQNADLVALSASISLHIDGVAEIITALRASEATRNVRVLVGGYPFNVQQDLWKQVGADGTAHDADGAIAAGNRLVGR